MVKYIVCLVCSTCVFVNTHGQDQKVIDSLQLLLRTQTGGERFPALYELAFEYINKDNVRALEIIQQAESAALLSGDSLSIVKSKRVRGHVLYFLERYREAETDLNSALSIAVRNKFEGEQLYIERVIASMNLHEGDYDKALLFSFRALELSKQLEDSLCTAITLHTIGVAYYKLKDYQKGLEYYMQSLKGNPLSPAQSAYMLANIALCYVFLGDLSSAREYVQRSIRDCGNNCRLGDRMNIAYTLGLIAKVDGQYDSAAVHFLDSYSMAQRDNNTRFQFDNIYLLSKIYMEKKQFQKASFYLQEAERLIRLDAPFNLEVIKIYSRLSELYLTLQDFQKASFYQSRYIHLKDSVYGEQFVNNLMKVQADRLERESQTRTAAQDQIILLKEEMIGDQRRLNFISGLLAVITMSFSVFLYKGYYKKRQLNLLLERKVKERTYELECSRIELLKRLKERDMLTARASKGIMETVNTIQGLCLTGRQEIAESVSRSYLGKIEKSSKQLIVFMDSLFYEGAGATV